jgi:Family of unknown function (DUF6308)
MSPKVIRVRAKTSKRCPPVRLRNGKEISDPLGDALAFIERDGSYQKYDEQFVFQDNTLTRNDVLLARKIIARTGDRVVESVLNRISEINRTLSEIPQSASPCSLNIPWTALKKLYLILVDIPGIRISRATKILHKKRPALIPILDNDVAKCLRFVEPSLVSSRLEEGIALTRSYKRELDKNLKALNCVRAALNDRGLDLTEVRLLDIYIWAYSRTYLPPFLRSQTQKDPEMISSFGLSETTRTR